MRGERRRAGWELQRCCRVGNGTVGGVARRSGRLSNAGHDPLKLQHRGRGARVICGKKLARTDWSEEKLAFKVGIFCGMVAAELEAGVIDDTREVVGGGMDWKRKMSFYRDSMWCRGAHSQGADDEAAKARMDSR